VVSWWVGLAVTAAVRVIAGSRCRRAQSRVDDFVLNLHRANCDLGSLNLVAVAVVLLDEPPERPPCFSKRVL